MKKVLAVCLPIVLSAVLAWAAVEKPTKPSEEYRSLMRANASLVDLTAGASGGLAALARDTNIEARVQVQGAKTLRELFAEKNFDEIARQTDNLKSNYEKIMAFWTEKKGDDGVALAQAGLKAIAEMHEAALTKNEKGIAVAQSAIERTCRDCHTAHRVIVLTDSSFQIRITPFESPKYDLAK